MIRKNDTEVVIVKLPKNKNVIGDINKIYNIIVTGNLILLDEEFVAYLWDFALEKCISHIKYNEDDVPVLCETKCDTGDYKNLSGEMHLKVLNSNMQIQKFSADLYSINSLVTSDILYQRPTLVHGVYLLKFEKQSENK